MAKDTHTPLRAVRIPDETWRLFGEACDDKGIGRSEAVRRFMEREIAAFQRRQAKRAAGE
jgi:hypothetical protein